MEINEMKPSMSMFINTEAYDVALKKYLEDKSKKDACPHAGEKYCEYPYCNCKEKSYETK